MSNGAPCLSLSIDGREFQCAGEGTAQPVQGGYTGELSPNGNPNTARWKYTPKGWSFPGQTIEIDTANADVDYIEEKISTMADLDIVAYYNDAILSGRGRVEGDVEWSPDNATATIAFKGPGKYKVKSI